VRGDGQPDTSENRLQELPLSPAVLSEHFVQDSADGRIRFERGRRCKRTSIVQANATARAAQRKSSLLSGDGYDAKGLPWKEGTPFPLIQAFSTPDNASPRGLSNRQLIYSDLCLFHFG
jgi:hypothetical protein